MEPGIRQTLDDGAILDVVRAAGDTCGAPPPFLQPFLCVPFVFSTVSLFPVSFLVSSPIGRYSFVASFRPSICLVNVPHQPRTRHCFPVLSFRLFLAPALSSLSTTGTVPSSRASSSPLSRTAVPSTAKATKLLPQVSSPFLSLLPYFSAGQPVPSSFFNCPCSTTC